MSSLSLFDFVILFHAITKISHHIFFLVIHIEKEIWLSILVHLQLVVLHPCYLASLFLVYCYAIHHSDDRFLQTAVLLLYRGIGHPLAYASSTTTLLSAMQQSEEI